MRHCLLLVMEFVLRARAKETLFKSGSLWLIVAHSSLSPGRWAGLPEAEA